MNPLQPYKSVLIIKNNIISVLRLSIKQILEKSCFQDTIDGISIEVENFLNILEHLIYFCVKGNGLMLSTKMKQHPWKLFSGNCKSIPNNCIATIYQMDNLASDFAKIRAVIQMSLIEKRLHEYLQSAFNDKKLNHQYYTPDSIILSGNLPNIINEIIGLSAVNFSFDLKLNINHPGFYPIDYSAFLKFYQSPQSVLDDLTECEYQHSEKDHCHWKDDYEMILAKAKLESKQKAYFEEILLNRETKTSALENRNKILESEINTLESSVTDLQIQLTLLHEQYCKEIEKLSGSSSNLIIPSLKSVLGSRAEITSNRHPLARNISQIDSVVDSDFGKGDQSTSPLLQVVPFAFDGHVRDSYNKLSKMASSTGDLKSINSKSSQFTNTNENNNQQIPGNFAVGKQLMSEVTRHYYSPSNESSRRSSTNNISNQTKQNHSETSSDYSSRLYNFTLEEQRARIMESQELRKIMVKASRSPIIKAHRHAQLLDASKSLSFDLLDNYSLDESISDDAMDSADKILGSNPIFDNNYNCTNSHNDVMSSDADDKSPNPNPYPINVTNYYYLSSAPVSEELNEDNYFNVESSIANELIHSDPEVFLVNNNLHFQSPPELVRLSPLTVAEVPQNMEPLTSQRDNFHLSDNFVNGDRSPGRPGNSLN